MPSLNDIAELAEALQTSPIAITEDYCIAVRNRNASCTRCADVCPANAVSVSANQITIDASACINCGACLAVCPTRALSAVDPTRDQLIDEIVAAADACGKRDGCEGMTVIACARRASKREAESSLFATVPCMAYIDEGLLVQIASCGISEIYLVDGVCSTCKYRKSSPATDETVRQAQLLLDAFGGTTRIQRVSAFPNALVGVDSAAAYGESRRNFFSDAASSAKETVVSAAATTMKQQLGIVEERASIGERLRVGAEGSLPKVPVPYHEALLDALDRIGAPAAESIDARTFATIDIDTDACNACGMCAVFCPTTALKRNSGEATSRVEYLEFQACDCIACGLCADVCFKKCLTVSNEVALDELFDFEPRVFDMPSTLPSGNIFGAFMR